MTKRVQGSILLADSDDESSALVERLSGQGLDVEWVRSVEEGIARGNEGADLVISEFHFPDHSGLRLVRELQSKNPRLPIVIVSREAGSDAAIEAIKLGAYDFLTKPVQFEELMEGIERALEDSRRSTTPVEIGEVYPEQDTIVGKGRAMREIYKQLGRIAAQPVTVLVRGETGTGKELIARAIYQHGHRSHKPFIAVNCAAIPDSLLESELFGHEKGSFTGADRMRIGRFEQAHGGTLFLDEIGDLDGQLQVKLLRVLQEKAIQRVGSQADIPVDVRVIAATHRDLETMIQEGDFRQDLFYRLNVVSLQIPSLRERSEDIPALIDYFLSRYGREFGIESPSIAPKAVEFLQQQDWPGNIRQLQNVLRKALLATRGYTIGWQDCRTILAEETLSANAETPSFSALVSETLDRVVRGELKEALPYLTEQFEREVYAQTIRRSGGNQAQAARWLGVSRFTLREKLRHFHLHPKED
ncbi:MAG: sigma-54 dependent transcriptional regulator [Verrucomicrobiota bacterium]